MPDRVKQSIFNVLGARYGCPGEIPPFRVADVFAGSGSMGLEALSRGAVGCVFYEADKTALKALQSNLESLQTAGYTKVRTGNAWTEAARDAAAGAFDLVFLDPPYRDTQDTGPDCPVARFLGRIAESASSAAEFRVPMVVLHHFEKVRFSQLDAPVPWTMWDERKMGSSAVTYFMDRRDLELAPGEAPQSEDADLDQQGPPDDEDYDS